MARKRTALDHDNPEVLRTLEYLNSEPVPEPPQIHPDSPEAKEFIAKLQPNDTTVIGTGIKRRKKGEHSVVYFMRDTTTKSVKIGVSTDVHQRTTALKENNKDIRLIACVAGDFYEERLLHAYFDEHHVRGEWFDLTDEQIAEAVLMVIRQALTPPPEVSLRTRVVTALAVATEFGCDAKASAANSRWVIDQMVRSLTGDRYKADFEKKNGWDQGEAPPTCNMPLLPAPKRGIPRDLKRAAKINAALSQRVVPAQEEPTLNNPNQTTSKERHEEDRERAEG